MTLSIYCRFDSRYSASHVQLYPSLVRQQGVRDIRDNILFSVTGPVSPAGSAGRISDAFTACLGMGILYTRFFVYFGIA